MLGTTSTTLEIFKKQGSRLFFFLNQLNSNSKKVSSEQGKQSFKLFLLLVFNKETTKEEEREG